MGGIQIPQKKNNLRYFHYLLSKTKKIFARDHESVHALQEFGFQSAEFFMDTAYYAYDRDQVKARTGIKKTKTRTNHNHHTHANTPSALSDTFADTSSKYIVINCNKNGQQFLEDIITDTKEYISKWYDVYYVPVSQWTQKAYADMDYYHIIKQRLPEAKKLRLLYREDDFARFASIIKGAEKVISTRLHLFLIASFLWVETKVYPYQKKILKMKKIIEDHN